MHKTMAKERLLITGKDFLLSNRKALGEEEIAKYGSVNSDDLLLMIITSRIIRRRSRLPYSGHTS